MAQEFFKGKKTKALHKVTIDGKNYPYYAVRILYENVGATVGVTIVKPSDDLEPTFSLHDFIASGRVRKIKVSDVDGNPYTLLCTGDNLRSALGNIKKKSINGKSINTAYIPGRVAFR